MDRPSKILSTQFDVIYVQEATELKEEDWETLGTRLRNGVTPYQQIVADCNPDRPTHWLNQRFPQAGSPSETRRRITTRLEDNPAFYLNGAWTPRGAKYLARLEANLSGARRLRLLEGKWAASEGLIYDDFDSQIHVIDRIEKIPASWRRVWVVDFGHTNPFVWQDWAIDHDGRAILVQEIYRTQTLVEDHCKEIMRLRPGMRPEALVCDHDAEGRATLERHLNIRTVAAKKEVVPGIQAVQARLRKAGDGKPRLMVMRDALTSVDRDLKESRKPTCSLEEVDGYVWDIRPDKPPKEEPVKADDHGMDCWRYLAIYLDKPQTRDRKAVGVW